MNEGSDEKDPIIRDWPGPWYRSRPEVLTYETVLRLTAKVAVMESKLDDARKTISGLASEVQSLALSRATATGTVDVWKWVGNTVWGLFLTAITAGVWFK